MEPIQRIVVGAEAFQRGGPSRVIEHPAERSTLDHGALNADTHLTSRDSATDRAGPPGPASRAVVASRMEKEEGQIAHGQS